jgi:hypothetical protein
MKQVSEIKTTQVGRQTYQGDLKGNAEIISL